jgi:hypothetical protein
LTAKTACLNARRSTEAKKSESSCREARVYLVTTDGNLEIRVKFGVDDHNAPANG